MRLSGLWHIAIRIIGCSNTTASSEVSSLPINVLKHLWEGEMAVKCAQKLQKKYNVPRKVDFQNY